MKLRSCMDSLVSCFGNCLATCEKVLSGAKRCARKAFALLVVFSLVFSLPVSAGKLGEYSGVISIPSQSLGIRYNSLTENTDWGYSSVPASFEFSDNSYRFTYNQLTALSGVYSLVTSSDKEFEFIFNFGDGTDPPVDVSFEFVKFVPYFYFHNLSPHARYFKFTGDVELYCDNELVYSVSYTGNNDFPAVRPNQTFSVSRYMTLVYRTTASDVRVVDLEDETIRQFFEIKFENLLVNNQPAQLDRIEISIDNIETSIENIEEGVVNIQGTVTDMKEQLEDSSSPIWSAAGEKIADTVTGLFVPPQEDLVAKKQELEQKLDDKLGSAGDLVDVGEEFVSGVMGGFGRDDIANNYRLQFPGITFPMNGEEYVIIPAQEVKLNNRAFVIFQDALGFAVTAICFFSIIHICEDAIYCLISGVSYWGFIRSRHDK